MVKAVAVADAVVSDVGGTPNTINTICLDQEARAYEAHLRSLRVLRAAAGACTFLSLLVPIVFIPATVHILATETNASLATAGAIMVAISAALMVLFLLFAHLYFYGLRTLAGGSLRTARVMALLISSAMAVNAGSLAGLIVEIATASAPLTPEDWSRRPVLVAILVAY